MRVVYLVALVACSNSHSTPDSGAEDAGSEDAGVADARVEDTRAEDVAIADVGPDVVDVAPELADLIVSRGDDRMLEFYGVDLDGTTTFLYAADIGDQRLVRVVPSPNGRYGLVLLDRGVDPFERVGFIVDWIAADTTAEPMAAVAAVDPEGICERAINHQRGFAWRHDSGGVYVTCERFEVVDRVHTLVEAATFEVGVEDAARALGTDCALLAMPTETGALLTRGCDEASYWLDGEEFPTGGLIVHSWWNGRALVSDLQLEGSDFRYDELAWLTREGSEPLEATLPGGSLLFVPSSRGHVPIGFRPPGGAEVEAVRVRTAEGWIDTELPPCTNTNGVPELVRWAPDGSAFTASCREGSFIVREGGSVSLIEDVEFVLDLRWNAAATHLLHVEWVNTLLGHEYRWAISDALGQPLPLPELDALEPASVSWRVGERAPGCGPLTVCGW